jgi:hypothetical protein
LRGVSRTREGRTGERKGTEVVCQAILTVDGRCAKLALPDEFYTDPLRQQWNNQVAEVHGRAFVQPNTETDFGVLSAYSEKDRKLAIGMCDHGLGFYVDTLRSASGRTWPGSP